METPLIADRYFDPKEAIRETERFVTIKKNPPCKGDFSKGFYPFVIEDGFSIFVFSRKANISSSIDESAFSRAEGIISEATKMNWTMELVTDDLAAIISADD